VYIEGDHTKYQDLLSTAEDFATIHTIEAYVAAEGEFALDALLARTFLPQDFELLSVDIDGDDWHVWRGSTRYRPRLS
jgi:hypothetical protein